MTAGIHRLINFPNIKFTKHNFSSLSLAFSNFMNKFKSSIGKKTTTMLEIFIHETQSATFAPRQKKLHWTWVQAATDCGARERFDSRFPHRSRMNLYFIHSCNRWRYLLKVNGCRSRSTPQNRSYCLHRPTHCVKLVKLNFDFRLRSCNMSYVQCWSTLTCGGVGLRQELYESTQYRYNNALWSPLRRKYRGKKRNVKPY